MQLQTEQSLISAEGAPIDSFYVLTSGSLRLRYKGRGGHRDIKPGAYFGEHVICDSQDDDASGGPSAPIPTSAVARVPSTLARITRSSFERHVGALQVDEPP